MGRGKAACGYGKGTRDAVGNGELGAKLVDLTRTKFMIFVSKFKAKTADTRTSTNLLQGASSYLANPMLFHTQAGSSMLKEFLLILSCTQVKGVLSPVLYKLENRSIYAKTCF